MMSCISEHLGAEECPECGNPHTEFKRFPERCLTLIECREMIQARGVKDVMPIYRIEGEDKDGYFMKLIPALVAITETDILTLWNNPDRDDGWVIAQQINRVGVGRDDTLIAAANLGEVARENAYMKKEVLGRDIVKNDTELPNISDGDYDHLPEQTAD